MDEAQVTTLFSHLRRQGIDREKLELLLSTGTTLTGPTGLRRWCAERSFEYYIKAYHFEEFFLPSPAFHRTLFRDLQEVADRGRDGKRGVHRAFILPRGSAKSSIVSRLFPIFCMLTGTSALTVLLASTATAARRMIKNIRDVLSDNEPLNEDFSISLNSNVLQQERVEYLGNAITCFPAKSGAVRGVSKPGQRPSLVIADDIDTDESVRSAREVEAACEWWDKSILALGDNISYTTSYLAIGTLIRRTSLLQHIADDPGFVSTIKSAVIRYADTGDLWEQWRTEFIRLAKEGKKPLDADSDAFYVANKEAMLEGTELLWPREGGYWSLMAARLSIGEQAWASEYMNQPQSAGGTLGVMPRCPMPPADELKNWWRIGSLDPTIKGGRKNDLAAWVEAYYNPATKTIIVSYCDAQQRPASKTIDVVLRRLRGAERFQGLYVESNAAGTLIADSIQQGIDKENLNYSVTQVHNSTPKDTRIGALSIYAARQQLFFADDIDPELVNEWDGFGSYRWDDALDACATIVQELAKQGFLDL